jgi:hypothetical protein
MSEEQKKHEASLLRSHAKNIFCLESLWNGKVEKKLSVMPLLELSEKSSGIKYIHLSCNTISEFKFNLKFLRRKKSYQILYLAFHGSVGSLHFADGTNLNLDDLAEIMQSNFTNLVVHFSSCNTLKAEDKKLSEFVKKTKVKMLSGYTKNVDWNESAALELLFFSALQNYKNISYLNSFFEKNYPDLIKATSFKTFTN